MAAVSSKPVRVLKRALALKPSQQRQALAAAWLLGYANLALKLLPFSKAISWGSADLGRARGAQAEIIRDIVRAVERASYATPWRTVCIHQGLVAQRMLRQRGVAALLCYGTRQFEGKLQSHVWVAVGNEIVIGGEQAPNYHVVAVYPRAGESSTSRPFSSLST